MTRLDLIPEDARQGASSLKSQSLEQDQQQQQQQLQQHARCCCSRAYRQQPEAGCGRQIHPRKLSCVRPKSPLLHHDKAPEYLRSPHFTQGYRQCERKRDALYSLFHWHVDFLDTWSSVIDVFHSTTLLLLAMYCMPDIWHDGATMNKAVLWAFYAVSWLHAPASVSYHLIGCAGISVKHFELFDRLDYTMIFVASIPLAWCLGYFVLGTAALCVCVGGVILSACNAVWAQSKHRLKPEHRINHMMLLVAFYLMPVVYQIYANVAAGEPWRATTVTGCCAIVSLFAGAYCYGAKWPECVYQDSPVSGHTLMHVGVNAAYFFEWLFILAAMRGAQQGGSSELVV